MKNFGLLRDSLNLQPGLEDKNLAAPITPKTQTELYDVVERFMYYPFGMKWEDVWPLDFNPEIDEENRFLYNGKELHRGSGLYDYGFRYYLAEIGRFTGVDPLAEEMPSWSPYNYCFNNPIKFIDPDGLAPDNIGVDKKGNVVYDDGKNDGNLFLANDGVGDITSLEQLKQNSTQLAKDNVWIGTEGQMVDYVASQWGHAEGGFNWFPHTNNIKVESNDGSGMAVNTFTGSMGKADATNFKQIELTVYDVGDKQNIALSNPYNTRNTISHEKMHLLQNVRHSHRALGRTNINIAGQEIEAINYQMSTSSWNKTTPQYQNAVEMYKSQWR